MTSNFLPEFKTMPTASGYAGLYRLFDESDWRYIHAKGVKGPKVFETASQAIAAAREEVKRKLNPELKCADMKRDEDDADLLQIEKWRADKIELYAATRALIKNGKNRRQVVVETKKKRKVATK